MSFFNQTRALIAVGIEHIGQRLGAASLIVIGTAGITGVLASILGMALSVHSTVLRTGDANRAIVLQTGAQNELASTLSMDVLGEVTGAPGIARGADGKPLASAEVLGSAQLMRRDGQRATLGVRGVGSQAFEVRPEIKLTAGRMFQPGVRELIVGRSAQSEFAGLAIGDRVLIRDGEWTIVGRYSSENALESALLTDADTLQSAYVRSGFNSITVTLAAPDGLAQLAKTLAEKPNLFANVLSERQYYETQSDGMSRLLFIVAYVITGIMGIGALFTALNATHAAVGARVLEIATLRAIGFGAAGVLLAVLSEAVVLSLVGALVGSTLAWTIFSGNFFQFGDESSLLFFRIEIGLPVIGIAILLACGIGLLGALVPAIRAARLQVATALREA